jgi:hypothetical protein
MDAAA